MKKAYATTFVLLFFLAFALTNIAHVPNNVKAQEPQQTTGDFGNIEFPPIVNCTRFWSLFSAHSAWDLEYDDGSGWKSVKTDLKITKNYTEKWICKITLNFTASHTADYRLTFGIDLDVKNYTHKEGAWNYTITYQNYTVNFDWSDIMSIPNLIVTHGVKPIGDESWFWFRIRKDDVQIGKNLVIDPTFGYSGSVTSEWGEYQQGSMILTKFQFITASGYNGTGTSMGAYVSTTYDGSAQGRMRVYNDSAGSPDTKIGETGLFYFGNTASWETEDFTTVPTFVNGTYYWLGVYSGTNIFPDTYSAYYTTGDTSQSCFWYSTTKTFYDRKIRIVATYSEVSTNNAPTIGEFQAPATVYANKYFFLNTTINDDDGVADFDYATIQINGSVVLKWVNSTNVFSEQSDASGYCTLDVAGSTRTTVNSTAYKLSWKIKLTWTYPEGSINVIVTNTKVYDSQAASGSGSQTGLFTFEDDLIVNSASVNDARVNPSQSLTFTGQLYYQGTSTAPESTIGITAKIGLTGIVKGSTTVINSTGHFQISLNAEANVANHTYTVYAVTDQNTVQNKTVYVVVDRAVITIVANTTSPAPNAYVSFTITAIYDFNDAPITSWTVNILRNNTHFASANFTDGGYTDLFYVYTIENMTETAYGLTSFTSNTITVYWSTYVALTIKTVDLDGNILTEAIVYFNTSQITVDSGGLATKTGLAKNHNVNVKVEWHGIKVNGTWTTNMTATKTIEASCNVWSITVNARDAAGTILSLSPSKFVWNFPNGTQVNATKSDGSWIFKIMNGTHYYKIEYQGQWICANVTLPVNNKNVTVINKNCWVYSLTVYVTNQNDVEMSGATLTVSRTDNASLSDYGLTPKTVAYYNATHGRYVWTQLSNQTSSYTIKVTSGVDSKTETTTLTEDTEKEIVITTTISGGPGGPGGPGPAPPPEQPPYIAPVVLPKVPGAEFNYGILVLVGVVGIAATVAVVGRGKPSLETQWKRKTRFVGVSSRKWKKAKHRDLSGKWRRKMKR